MAAGWLHTAHGRAWTEAAIGGAPIWARNTVLAALATKAARKASEFEGQSCCGLAQALLKTGSPATGQAGAAGWGAIVGGETAAGGARAAQSSPWEDARRPLRLKPWQAIAMGIAKLVLWHWSQPLAYLWVFVGVYFCELDSMQRSLGTLVAVREIVYMLTTIVAAIFCPAYLLLDIGTVWNKAETRLQRGTRIAAYILTPHNYVALCLGNRFPSANLIFMFLAFLQVACDFASCVALVLILKDIGDASAAPTPFDIPLALILKGDSASQTGHFAINESGAGPGEWTLSGDDLELSWSGWDGPLHQQRGAPVALALGYGITAASFVLFFGPALVASLVADASNEGKGKPERVAKGLLGGAMGIGLAYLLLVFALLAAGVDTECGGWVGSYPCGFWDPCAHGSCSRGKYACTGTFFTFFGGKLCDTDLPDYAQAYTLSGCSDPSDCGVFHANVHSGNLDRWGPSGAPAQCDGAPVYQLVDAGGGAAGPVLYRYSALPVQGERFRAQR